MHGYHHAWDLQLHVMMIALVTEYQTACWVGGPSLIDSELITKLS